MTNDRFKFRVWDEINKKYLTKGCLHRDGYLVIPTMKNNYDVFSKAEGNYVLEQCTGLKDKNGTLIYEGDIVQTDYEGVKLDKYIYRWEPPAFYVEPIEKGKPTGTHYYYFAVCTERCTVIGNIHENKELLND